jgi:tryptophan 2,3-dioxygenase
METKIQDPKIVEKIQKLAQKYEAMGQDLESYLEGLLQADYLNYWHYINLDTLLTLQQPRTPHKDEMVFICYHQITELFFKLTLWEMEQMTQSEPLPADKFLMKLKRCIRYFESLEQTFVIMTDGMEREQFLEFRMALLPASGFQSAQYRMIELQATNLYNLLGEEDRKPSAMELSTRELMQKIYWTRGATELESGKKTLTLEQFEAKYTEDFLKLVALKEHTNLWQQYVKHYASGELAEEIRQAMRQLDLLSNVFWPLAHYKTSVRYLQHEVTITATGGTNWQKYLPPRFRRIQFYPELWTEEERREWGKPWVMKHLRFTETE